MATAWANQLTADNDKNLDYYYREYHQELCRYAVSKFGLSYSEAEDLVQEAFARMAPQFRDGSVEHVRAFLYRSVHNATIDALRKGQVRESYAQSVQGDPERDQDNLGPERVASSRQFLGLISRALWNMPHKRRRLLLMNRVDGLSYAEIARREGLSATVVKKHVAKALAGCQEALRVHGGDL
ncbi:RNA polymerase sigma factor [uncultured Microbulbifer sp.]|uniref:RNA polymerase sigma factor n=1 Tax=uncultured Microbulbifer sp. TaxID=348147 RepID=UPI0025F406E0|nr:RNA polymerase sigma factor [uncultured Microbulbifer sp.]